MEDTVLVLGFETEDVASEWRERLISAICGSYSNPGPSESRISSIGHRSSVYGTLPQESPEITHSDSQEQSVHEAARKYYHFCNEMTSLGVHNGPHGR